MFFALTCRLLQTIKVPGALASNFGELAKYDVGLFVQTEHGVHVYVLKGMQFVHERMVRTNIISSPIYDKYCADNCLDINSQSSNHPRLKLYLHGNPSRSHSSILARIRPSFCMPEMILMDISKGMQECMKQSTGLNFRFLKYI